MTVVVQFKPKEHSPEATRRVIEADFERLMEKHGAYEVVTVAAYIVAMAIDSANAKNTPTAVGWAADLQACLVRAAKAARRHRWVASMKAHLRALQGSP
jgi:hypothetical protein